MTTLKPRTASVVIYQGDDLARLAELRQESEAAIRSAERAASDPRRTNDPVPSADAEKSAYDAFVDEAAERALVVEVCAIGRRRFAELVAEHPARTKPKVVKDEDGVATVEEEPHPDDAPFDVNVETFGLALLLYIDGEVRTLTQPDFPTKAALQDFLDNDLSDGDFRDLWITAYYLNRAPSADPKSVKYGTGSPRSTTS